MSARVAHVVSGRRYHTGAPQEGWMPQRVEPFHTLEAGSLQCSNVLALIPSDFLRRSYAAVETGIKTGIESRLGGETLCLSHCGYTSGLCCIVPTSRPVWLWLTRLTASPTIS